MEEGSSSATRPHCVALRRLIAIGAAVVCGLVFPAAPASADTQLASAGVAARIMDYEVFEENHVCNFGRQFKSWSLNDGYSVPVSYRAKCGGEIRVEVYFRIENVAGAYIRVTQGQLIFFEGDSADTNAIAGFGDFPDMVLYPTQTVTRQIHLWNSRDNQPDDKADVTVTISNG